MADIKGSKGEIRVPGSPITPNSPYVVWDLCGYPYNMKYPPDVNDYGAKNHGYPTEERETFFYDFAVLGYDVSFRYKGKPYYLVSCEDHVAISDATFNIEYEVFPDGNSLLENFKIGGRPLVDIIDELEDVEPV